MRKQIWKPYLHVVLNCQWGQTIHTIHQWHKMFWSPSIRWDPMRKHRLLVINDPDTIHSSIRGSNPSRYRFARISFPRHAQHIVRQKLTHSKGINEAKLERCLLFTHVMSAMALSATKNLLIVRQKRKTQQQQKKCVWNSVPGKSSGHTAFKMLLKP